MKIKICSNCQSETRELRRDCCLKCYRKIYHLSLGRTGLSQTNMPTKIRLMVNSKKSTELKSKIKLDNNVDRDNKMKNWLIEIFGYPFYEHLETTFQNRKSPAEFRKWMKDCDKLENKIQKKVTKSFIKVFGVIK